MKYINQFLSLRCCTDMVNLKLFPNGKEITESFGAFRAVSHYVGLSGDIFCIGDGRTPRTGALFAFMTKLNVWSIDPDVLGDWTAINNLAVIRAKIEDVPQFVTDKAVIVSVHSHAPVQAMWDSVKAREKWMIHIPCCTTDMLGFPALCYQDKSIKSPKNIIYIWKQELSKTKGSSTLTFHG